MKDEVQKLVSLHQVFATSLPPRSPACISSSHLRQRQSTGKQRGLVFTLYIGVRMLPAFSGPPSVAVMIGTRQTVSFRSL